MYLLLNLDMARISSNNLQLGGAFPVCAKPLLQYQQEMMF
jgi:hypothetical protein